MRINGTPLPIYPLKPTDPTLQPADALLRESMANQSQYSPATQHEKIVEAMARKLKVPIYSVQQGELKDDLPV
jgi:hypothetical protein